MNVFFQTVCILILSLASAVHAAMPEQKDVFTIAIFGGGKQNYVSTDFIYSALPFYDEIGSNDDASSIPWSKNAYTQQGAIVLQNKSVLFFDTQSSKYLTLVDSSNKSSLYRLVKTPTHLHACPRYTKEISGLPFPNAEDVFCVATFPWNKDEHFSSTILIAALPRFRPLVKSDVPEKATESSTGNPHDPLIYYPKEWERVQHSNSAGALNGVIVLTNKAVLRWITWTPTAIAFENYRVRTYFILDQ